MIEINKIRIRIRISVEGEGRHEGVGLRVKARRMWDAFPALALLTMTLAASFPFHLAHSGSHATQSLFAM